MDNKQFVSKLSRQTAIDYKETSSLVQSVVAALVDTLCNGDDVAIPGFGNFTTVKEDETISVDISTGKRMLLPPHIDMRFTPSKILTKHLS